MLTPIKWCYLLAILLAAIGGGYLPLARRHKTSPVHSFHDGEAFSSGVFLALALMMLLPSAFGVFRQALPEQSFPIGSVVAIVAFLILLALEHAMGTRVAEELSGAGPARGPAAIPILMTAMIAAPSFFLGVALGISDPSSAALIFIAIMLHKSTAGFALALAMTRSRLTRTQTLALFGGFAVSTPLGILAGGLAREELTGGALLAKATVLSLGAGTFLYMGTLHELKRSAMVESCSRPRCFFLMLAGLGLTILVRWIVGEAHQL
jgi:zinc transporter ZupT